MDDADRIAGTNGPRLAAAESLVAGTVGPAASVPWRRWVAANAAAGLVVGATLSLWAGDGLGLLFGLVILGPLFGGTQWLALRGRLPRANDWPIGTTLGVGAGWSLAFATVLAYLLLNTPTATVTQDWRGAPWSWWAVLSLATALAGGLAGVVQLASVGRVRAGAGTWMAASALGAVALLGAVAAASWQPGLSRGLGATLASGLAGVVGGTVYGGLTGAALRGLLRDPIGAAARERLAPTTAA